VVLVQKLDFVGSEGTTCIPIWFAGVLEASIGCFILTIQQHVLIEIVKMLIHIPSG